MLFLVISIIAMVKIAELNRREPRKFSINTISSIEIDMYGQFKVIQNKEHMKAVVNFLNSLSYEAIEVKLRRTGGYINYIDLKISEDAYEHIAFYGDKINHCSIKNEVVVKDKWYKTNENNLEDFKRFFESF